MSMKKILISLALLLSLSAQGQEVLTLKQCREMALQNNKEMAAAVKQTQSARYMQKSFKANFLPNITAQGTGMFSNMDGTFSLPGGNLPVFVPNNMKIPIPNGSFAYFPGIDLNYEMKSAYMAGIQIDQPIFMGGKIIAGYKMSKLGKEMALLNETLTANEVILKTENAYALLVKATEMKKVADSYHQLLTELMKMVESAHKHGLKPQNDVLKVQVKLNESELSIRKAENATRLASMNLCHLIGKPLNTDLEIDATYPHINESAADAVMSIDNRPEYNLLDKKIALAKQKVNLSRSELLPQIGVRGSYSYMNGLKINNQKLFDNDGFAVMVNVSIPIFHFGERYNKMRAAKSQLEQARMEQGNLNEKMMLELTQATNNWEEAQLEAQLADKSLQQATENQKVSKSQYEAGLETLSDYLEAQALWQQAYATQVDTHFRVYLEYVNYLKAAGLLQ